MKRLIGYFITFCGWILLFPGFALKSFSEEPIKGGGIAQQIVQRIILLMLNILSQGMIMSGEPIYIDGRKRQTLPINKLLEKDKRPPVLYLRSFELEPLTNQGVVGNFTIRTIEEGFAKNLKRIGPCVAVGNPKSNEIILGFSRFTFGDDWEERVKELMKQSALVVLCAGGTGGLLWELEQVAELVKPRSKLVLIITPTVTEKWWKEADKLFGKLPRFTIQSGTIYNALIYFDQDDKPHHELIYGYNGSRPVTLEDAFDSVLKQNNIPPRPRIIKWLSVPANLGCLTFILLILSVLIWIFI